MIKVLVSDMDGTLFEKHGETVFDLSERNELALNKIKNSDIDFFVASGRMIGYGIRLLEKYGFEHVCAAGFNGAVCYDHNRIVATKPLRKELIAQIMELLMTQYPTTEIIQVQGLNSERIFCDVNLPIVEQYRKEIAKIGIGNAVDFTIWDFLAGKNEVLPGKLSITMPTHEACLAVIDSLKQLLKEECFVTMSNDTLIEIGNSLAHKGVFIEYLIQTYGYQKEEIAVIGDAPNDMEMFPYAGYQFAMASGKEQVKAAADRIVEDVAECIEICLEINRKEKGENYVESK